MTAFNHLYCRKCERGTLHLDDACSKCFYAEVVVHNVPRPAPADPMAELRERVEKLERQIAQRAPYQDYYLE